MPAREKIAFAADLPLPQALHVYESISPFVGWAKVGLSLFVEHGPEAVRAFLKKGARVFLDLKLHDIPNTVELAAEKVASLGVGLLTVHASGGEAMLRAAHRGAEKGALAAGVTPPRILAVTVLTSMSEQELEGVGVFGGCDEQVLRLARVSKIAGTTGLVCSAQEVTRLRRELGEDVFLCTPGIRPAGAAAGDQTRIETPASAIRAGANLLVVGRPIYEAPSPAFAAQAISDEVSKS
jgi:orotidine-5'-phosphate decarboxylase